MEIKWYEAKECKPPRGKYVLAARQSGYGNAPMLEYLTAKYMEDYKGWTMIGNDRVTDSGYDVEYWTDWWPNAIGDGSF